jgi:hypothetical protein
MIRGSMAEHPRPASAKTARPGSGLPGGMSGTRRNAMKMTAGRILKTTHSGIHRSIKAKSKRPPVPAPQKSVRARDAVALVFASALDMRIEAQLPFIVSQIP